MKNQTNSNKVESQCPKCRKILPLPFYRHTSAGPDLLFHCPECASHFILIPVTVYQLQEVQLLSRDWK